MGPWRSVPVTSCFVFVERESEAAAGAAPIEKPPSTDESGPGAAQYRPKGGTGSQFNEFWPS
jgi:hypothetical protein